jgi:hypothetical protein
MMNTFGTLLNDDLKAPPSILSIIEGQAEFGGNAATQKNIPINLVMAGKTLFYSMVIGKEGMSGWWCSYLKLFKNDWQKLGHEYGEPWTIETLTEHAKRIANHQINTKNIHAVCVVRGKLIFDALLLRHFITPILYVTIGKGNSVLDNYVAELQATAEGYTDDYHAAKIAEVKTMAVHLHAKEQLAQFTMVMSEYEKDFQWQQQRNTLSYADQGIVVSELADIVEERAHLQDAVPATKNNYVQTKKMFAAEKKKPENGKAFGQPINAKMNEDLKKNGID